MPKSVDKWVAIADESDKSACLWVSVGSIFMTVGNRR